MPFKTPSFWYRENASAAPLTERCLMPLTALYRLGYEIHQHRGRRQKFDIPIICVGNINAGGTGKTPTVIALMRTIKKIKLAPSPFFMSRGYGGGELGPLMVDPAKHTAWHTGDEPIMLATIAPTIVSRRRADGILMAMYRRADLIVMDDGLQNPDLQKDINLVVINGDMGFGNGKMLPAGPLREPLSNGLKNADAFVLIGEDRRGVLDLLPVDKPVFRGTLHAENQPAPEKKYIAFAGIGYPEKFYRFLREKISLDIVDTIDFPDHYPYTEEDIQNLSARAASQNAVLITTEKDFMRIPTHQNKDISVLKICLEWDDEPALAAFLQSKIKINHDT